jgi:hypothetical protein
LGEAFVAGRKRVPNPAAGKTALRIGAGIRSNAPLNNKKREGLARLPEWLSSYALHLA